MWVNSWTYTVNYCQNKAKTGLVKPWQKASDIFSLAGSQSQYVLTINVCRANNRPCWTSSVLWRAPFVDFLLITAVCLLFFQRNRCH